MRHQRRPHLLAAAGEEGQHRWRHARLEQDLVQSQGDERRLLGRFHHHRVARDKRRHRHARQDRQWKIPRRDDNRHASGQPLGRILLARHIHSHRLSKSSGLVRVVAAEIDRLGDVGIGFPPRLTHFEDLDSRQVEPATPQDLRRLLKHGGPPLPANRLPGCQRPSGHHHCPIGVSGRGRCHVREQSIMIRRITAWKRLARLHFLAIDHDWHCEGSGREASRQPFDRLLHGATRRGNREVDKWLVAESGVSDRRDRRRDVIRHTAGGCCGPRRRQKRGGGHMLHEARAEERIVRGVLQEPPDEIRHSRHELAIGHVDP